MHESEKWKWSRSVISDSFVAPWTAAYQAPPSMGFSRQEYWSGVPLPSPAVSHSLLKFMFIEFMMLSNHLTLCHPLLTSSIFLSIRVFPVNWLFTSGGQSIWSLNFRINPSNEYSGLISFRMDWLDLLAVHGTLKSLLQCHNLKASILQHSDFFRVQPSYLYMTPGKTVVLTIQTFAGKVISLLFNVLS